MDAGEVSVPRMTRAAAAVLALLSLSVLAAGCGRRSSPSQAVSSRVDKELKRARKNEQAPITIRSGGSSFSVDDGKGRPLLEAKVETVDGTLQPGKGFQGPVRMKQAKCRLFKEGKPQLDLDSPEAVWDGKRLSTEKAAHGVTPDGNTVMDAQKAVWTAETGHITLENATLKSMKKGQVDFTGQAPRVSVVEQVATMSSGATGRNAEGQQLTADHVRWHLQSGKLEATGNVVVTGDGTRITGQKLVADTKLKRGRITGRTRVHMKPGAAKSTR